MKKIVSISTPADEPPTAFTTAEIYKIAQHLRWLKSWRPDRENGVWHEEIDPISETSSFYCPAPCGERLWLLDLIDGPRSRDVESCYCPACGRLQNNPHHDKD